MEQQDFTCGPAPTPPIVTLPEEIDAGNADRLARVIDTGIPPGTPTAILDGTGTTFCDSLSARMLYYVVRDAAARGTELRIAAHPHLLRILELMGYDNFLSVYSTLAAATTT